MNTKHPLTSSVPINKNRPLHAPTHRYIPLTQSPTVQRMLTVGYVDSSTAPAVAPSDITYLQSTIGNRAVQRMLLDPNPQKYETEAGVAQRSPTAGVGAEGGMVDQDVEARIKQSQSGGAPMPSHIRDILQPKLQADFKNVKVHTDKNAAQLSRDLNAQAFTYKNHIFYGEGKSPDDLELTAHEAVHTIQQGAVARRFDAGIAAKQGAIMQPAVQRLPTAAELEGSAGTAKKDWKLGKLTLRRMSTKYKAVLNALRAYDTCLERRVGGDRNGYNLNSVWDVDASLRLDNVEEAVDAYLASHNSDDRAGQIQNLKNEIPRERALVQYIGAHADRYADMTGREALVQADKDGIVDKAMTAGAKNTAGFGSGKSMDGLLDVTSGDNEEANASLNEQLTIARTAWSMNEGQVGDAFRKSDTLSKTSAEYAKGNFLPYFVSTVMPAFAEVIQAIRGSGIGLIKDMDTEGLETPTNDPAANASIAQVYERFVQTVIRALPNELINGAAVVYARVRKSTQSDSEAFSKKVALSTATNMIYVRCFGPALNLMSGAIGGDLTRAEKQAVTAIIQLLAKQGPGMDLSGRNDEYRRLGIEAGVQNAATEYQKILNQIIARGERLLT